MLTLPEVERAENYLLMEVGRHIQGALESYEKEYRSTKRREKCLALDGMRRKLENPHIT